MFNAGYKKEAIRACEKAGEEYKNQYGIAVSNCGKLYDQKEIAVKILKKYDDYINSIANTPRYIEKATSEIAVRRKAFENTITNLKLENVKGEKISQNIAGAGVLAGAGVAAFGPSAAMGIATTFGTASTGTAIAALSGAAQTNAALAWLGGGVVGSSAAAGGMAGGQALLAMAGPVGWAIGGAALVGGGILASSKNKKIAEKAEEQTRKIKNETNKMKELNCKVCAEMKAIDSLNGGIKNLLESLDTTTTYQENIYSVVSVFRRIGRILNMNKKRDFKELSEREQNMIIQLKNSAETLSYRIGVVIS